MQPRKASLRTIPDVLIRILSATRLATLPLRQSSGVLPRLPLNGRTRAPMRVPIIGPALILIEFLAAQKMARDWTASNWP